MDSSVAAALIHRAIGEQLTCVFVDHGLLRLNEGQMVMDMFARNLGVKVVHVDASVEFMGNWPAKPTRRKSARSSAPNSSKCSRPNRKS